MPPNGQDAPKVLAGRYRLVKLLGEGRSGLVHQAKDLQSQERVAVKLLYPQLATVRDHVRRFSREFDLLQRIEHPNVVGAIAFGEEKDGAYAGSWYIVMEYVEGRRLDEVLAQGALEIDRSANVLLGVARALEAAHALGVVHRDVEPSNVMLARTRHGEVVKVLDFGVARLQAGDESLTDVGVKLGTAEYMSPEYVEEGLLDARSDLYALGVLAYALLTGAPPFVGPTMKVMQDHVNTPVTPPSVRVPGLPPWLELLTMRLLAKDPAARPADAHAVVVEIEQNLGQLVADVKEERLARQSLPPEPMEVRAASVGHRAEAGAEAAYPDARGAPSVPVTVAAGLGVVMLLGVLIVLLVLAIVVVVMVREI
jgi:serine/threonine protein kinase